MRKLRYGNEIQDFTCFGYQIKWIFPEIIHINKDTLYEIEYKVTKIPNQCIYKVTYIKSVNELIERINFIVNMFNTMDEPSAFEEWFREHYKLLVIPGSFRD